MAITAAVVNELRQATGCGLMDCKKALIECEGDMEKAVMYLREKGLASQAKKASRVAAEGMAYATVIDGVGVVVEVNCETDFVANGEPFNNFVKGVAAVVAKENPADVDALMGCPWVTGNGTVKDAKDELFLAIRENMSIRRFARIADGFSVPYVHMKGKIGVIVNLTVEGCDATEIGKDIAMQISTPASGTRARSRRTFWTRRRKSCSARWPTTRRWRTSPIRSRKRSSWASSTSSMPRTACFSRPSSRTATSLSSSI